MSESGEDATAQAVRDRFEKIERALKLLPAWFVPRMMDGTWCFGLVLSTGRTLAIENIYDVHQAADGSLWIEVRMSANCGHIKDFGGHPVITAPTARDHASINASHVVMAFELADA